MSTQQKFDYSVQQTLNATNILVITYQSKSAKTLIFFGNVVDKQQYGTACLNAPTLNSPITSSFVSQFS